MDVIKFICISQLRTAMKSFHASIDISLNEIIFIHFIGSNFLHSFLLSLVVYRVKCRSLCWSDDTIRILIRASQSSLSHTAYLSTVLCRMFLTRPRSCTSFSSRFNNSLTFYVSLFDFSPCPYFHFFIINRTLFIFSNALPCVCVTQN